MKSKNNKFNNNDLLAKIFEQRENEIYKIKNSEKNYFYNERKNI